MKVALSSDMLNKIECQVYHLRVLHAFLNLVPSQHVQVKVFCILPIQIVLPRETKFEKLREQTQLYQKLKGKLLVSE